MEQIAEEERPMHRSKLAFAAMLLLSVMPASAQTAPARTLTIVGHAEMRAAPDTAIVTAGVTTETDTAAAAMQTNSAAMGKVVDAIRSAGVEARDIQTSGLSLEPRYDRPEKVSASSRPRITGYSAANEVTVQVRDLAKLGNLLDKVVLAGANRIEGIEFKVAREAALLDGARQKAVADAKSKADLYAQAAGVTLGKIMSLAEETVPAPRRMARAVAAPSAVAVPVEAGEMTLSTRVRVVWSLTD
jgi:uncharacterized protein